MIRIVQSILYKSIIEGELFGDITMGFGCHLLKGSMLDAQEGYIKLGRQCSVNRGSCLFGQGGLEIGNYVRIAQNVLIYSSAHNYHHLGIPIHHQGITEGQVKVGDNVWIGAGVIICKGVQIGSGTVIGAGVVIKEDIPDFSIVTTERKLKIRSRF